jgi:hypothetical protein
MLRSKERGIPASNIDIITITDLSTAFFLRTKSDIDFRRVELTKTTKGGKKR